MAGEMADEMAGDSGLELDLLAASLRAGGSDVVAYLEGLASKLEQAVPGLVRVERGRQGLFGPKTVRRIAVEGGGERLELLAEGGGDRLLARRGRVSGGIVLKSEEVGIDAWTQALGAVLAAEAARSQQTRQALERLLLD